jgi:hypothetical protein
VFSRLALFQSADSSDLKETATMNKPENDRRRISQAELLDSAIRALGQLSVSNDLAARSLAIRALADVQQVRRQVPTRRAHDREVRIG